MKQYLKFIQDSNFAHKEIYDDFTNCAEYRWQNKKVYDKKVLWHGDSIDNFSFHGKGSMELNSNITLDSKNSLLIKTNTDIQYINPRPSTSVHLSINNENWEDYNRISLWVYPKSEGFHNFYFHFTLFNEGTKPINHAPSLEPNKWNNVIWEIPLLERNKITKLSITPFLMGCPDEALGDVEFYINKIEIQNVDADYDEGWDIENRIAYFHIGYLPNSKKIALTQISNNQYFEVYDENNQIVLKKEVNNINTELGDFFQLDFSEIEKDGNYYLKIDNRTTNSFPISKEIYNSSIWKSMNFFRLLRCGEDIENVHSACHLTSYSTHSDGRMVPNFGGWHDAGDVSQFEICTAEMAHALCDLAEKVKEKDSYLYDRLREEARVGLNWLLRTRFGEGYRALAITYSIWTKSEIIDREKLNKTFEGNDKNVSENGPFENFLAVAALASASRVFSDDEVFSKWCKRVAIDDFKYAVKGFKEGKFTKRWGPSVPSQVCGAGALAAAELYLITQEEDYKEIAVEYANTIILCQQSSYPNWEKPIRGFFYEDIEHSKILTYEHRGHEQSPIHGIARVLEVFKDHKDNDKWINCLNLYKEYILSTIDYTKPYGLLPAQIYDINKLYLERFTIPKNWGTEEEVIEDLKGQIKTGIKLSENIYLRKLPIAIQRRGYLATQLSKTKSVSLIARLLNDQKLKQIVLDQIEWMFGKNPFETSSMYGEGHNYHPLYVAFSMQMVGSLPVGFKTYKNNDAPYWPVINNAVFKEIWGHTSGKYLWVLADIL